MGSKLTIPGTAKLSLPYESGSTNQGYILGLGLEAPDGREWIFGENGATLAVAGSLYQTEVPAANDDDIAVAAAEAVGQTAISLTANGNAIVIDEFNGGFMVVQDDAGEGIAYAIKDTPAAAASAAFTLVLGHGIEVALTTATTVLLLKHPMKDVIIHLSPPTAPVVGVAAVAIAANEFGWFQTRGIASVLTDGTVLIGQQVMASDNTNGAVEARNFTLSEATPNTLDGTQDQPTLGVVHEVAATGEHSAINLQIL